MSVLLWLTLVMTQAPRATATRTAALDAVSECLHWSGEDPVSAARAQQIKRGREQSCAMAVKALRDAQQQLPDDDAVAWALVEYLGNDGECSLVPKQGLAQACRGAKRFAARDAAAGSGVFDTFCVEYACQVGRCAPLHLALERSCQGKR